MAVISVIVPVYKVEPYLHRCVDSILNQSFSDFDLILVDDGSPDNCGAICEEYAAKDTRVHVIHQENGGLSAARNAGIDWAFAHSDSQWVTFIDSDDWVHAAFLQTLMDAAKGTSAAMAVCALKTVEEKIPDAPILDNTVQIMDAEQAYAEHYTMCINACCKVYKKALFSQIRFPYGKLHEDAYVTHLLTFDAKTVAVCNAPLYYYFSNPDSITRVKWSEKRLDQIEAHELRLSYLAEHDYRAAYKAELEAYVITLFAQAQDLRLLCKEEKAYRAPRKALQKKLLPALRLARKHGLIPFEETYIWIYELAYPVKPIWILRNLLHHTEK